MNGVQLWIIGPDGHLIAQQVGPNDTGEINAAVAQNLPASRLFMPIQEDSGFAQPKLMFAADDEISTSELYAQACAAIGYGYNGGAVADALDRLRTLSVENFDSTVAPKGVQLSARPAEWSTTSSASNASAVTSRAAVANQRHVITGYSCSVYNPAAAGIFQMFLRNGAAGTIMWRAYAYVNASQAVNLALTGLHIVCDTNQAAVVSAGMNSGGGVTYTTEASLTGFTVPSA